MSTTISGLCQWKLASECHSQQPNNSSRLQWPATSVSNCSSLCCLWFRACSETAINHVTPPPHDLSAVECGCGSSVERRADKLALLVSVSCLNDASWIFVMYELGVTCWLNVVVTADQKKKFAFNNQIIVIKTSRTLQMFYCKVWFLKHLCSSCVHAMTCIEYRHAHTVVSRYPANLASRQKYTSDRMWRDKEVRLLINCNCQDYMLNSEWYFISLRE